MMDIIEQGLEILKQLGLTYEWQDHTRDFLEITDPVTGEWTRRDPYGVACLLDFLAKTGKLKLDKQPAASVTEGSNQLGADPKTTEQRVRDLIRRARAIGITLHDYGEKGYYYERRRFLIPGTRYKFYFYVGNALEPKRKRYCNEYYFGSDELECLEEWVAHDEKIFADCNRKYSVQET